MTELGIAVVILAAGHGTRMRSALPKVLHSIGGLPMLGHVIAAAEALMPARMAVVIGDHAPQIGDYAHEKRNDIEVFVQAPPQGTGDAVKQALPSLDGFTGAVVVLYADTPLVTEDTISALAEKIHDGAAVAVLGFTPEEAGGYGRLKRDSLGRLEAIIEAKDATPDELEIELCNSGVMAFNASFLRDKIDQIDNKNAKGEYYLTDLVALARAAKHDCEILEADADEVTGVNARDELAAAEQIFQHRKRAEAMLNGVTLIDPDTVYFSADTQLGNDITIHPNVVFGPDVTIDTDVIINAFSHIEGAHIKSGANIGPFARLRPGAQIGEDAKIGNFVEVKKATIGADAKVSHLSYIGDAEIGNGANIGAGTITCNYDGFAKFQTKIGNDAFIGSNSSLVAPVEIGDGAYVGSGSVITKKIEPGDLAVARGRQTAIKGWAERFRTAHAKKEKT